MAKKRNNSPEKIVEGDIKYWCYLMGWRVHIIDSKATFSVASGCYRKSKSAPEGFPDMVGSTNHLKPCYLELKASGKRSTVRDEQLTFLISEIVHGSFACVTDSTKHLGQLYRKWIDKDCDKVMLLMDLPRKQKVDQILYDILNKSKSLDLLAKYRESFDKNASPA